MPFSNPYNERIKDKLKNIACTKVAHLNQVANNPSSVETASQQDFLTAVAHPELEGGSGNLAATSFDLGIEPKTVGGAKVVKHRTSRTKKTNSSGRKLTTDYRKSISGKWNNGRRCSKT